MNMTSPTRQNIQDHIPYSLQDGLTFRLPQGDFGECKSHGKIECTKADNGFSSLSEVSTWPVALSDEVDQNMNVS